LRNRVVAMADAGRYQASLAVAAFGHSNDAATTRALDAQDRILSRPDPTPHEVGFGSRLVPDSYLVSALPADDQRACLFKALTVAEDAREAALNRNDALTAARNLVLDQTDDVKADAHRRARAFVTGDRDGSYLDAEVGQHRPLSAFQPNLGPVTLRGHGLASPTTAPSPQQTMGGCATRRSSYWPAAMTISS